MPEPQAIVEARALLDGLYGFDKVSTPGRYVQADLFRDDALRLVVLHFHLTCEEMLNALTYNAIRAVEGPQTFTAAQDIDFLRDELGTRQVIDLAARLRVIGKKVHKLLHELTTLRNRASHEWILSKPKPITKAMKEAGRQQRYPLEWRGSLLTVARARREFIPTYEALYLDLHTAYYNPAEAKRIKR